MRWFDRKIIRTISIIALSFYFYSSTVFSEYQSVVISHYDDQDYLREIEHIYRELLMGTNTIVEKVEKSSSYFLGKPYLLGSLGEGQTATYDKSPLFRTDAFDCVTFVSTVLALATSDKDHFVHQLKSIQYKNGIISFLNRNHFIELDWNACNHSHHLIQDITSKIDPACKIAYAFINKPSWFKSLKSSSLKNFHFLSDKLINTLLVDLHRMGDRATISLARTTYIPLSRLIISDSLNEKILDNIPSGAIIEIVDKTRNLKERIGTDLNIVHMGFAIKTANGLIFRHASKSHHRVIDVPLEQYLRRYNGQVDDPEKAGIHIEELVAI